MQCQGRTKLELASKHVLTIDDTAKIYSLFLTYIYVPFTNLYRYFEVIIQLTFQLYNAKSIKVQSIFLMFRKLVNYCIEIS